MVGDIYGPIEFLVIINLSENNLHESFNWTAKYKCMLVMYSRGGLIKINGLKNSKNFF